MAFEAALVRTRVSTAVRNIIALFGISLCLSSSVAQQPTTKQFDKPSSPPLTEAEALLREGRIEEAKSRIQEELQRNPTNAEAYDLLGVASVNEKDFPGALEAFQHALKLAPNSTRTRNSIANVHVAQGKLDLAEQELRTVLRVAPANRDANYNLGLVLLAQSAPAKAIPYFQRVRPASRESKFNLTRAYLLAGRASEGLKSATELSNENRDDVQIHFTLGVLLASQKQYRTAQLEQVYADEKKPVDALELLVRARKLAPQNTDVIFLLARVSMT